MLSAEGCRQRRLRLWQELDPKPESDHLRLGDWMHLVYLANFCVDPFSLAAGFGGFLLLRNDGHATLIHDNRMPESAKQAHVDGRKIVDWYDGQSPRTRSRYPSSGRRCPAAEHPPPGRAGGHAPRRRRRPEARPGGARRCESSLRPRRPESAAPTSQPRPGSSRTPPSRARLLRPAGAADSCSASPVLLPRGCESCKGNTKGAET